MRKIVMAFDVDGTLIDSVGPHLEAVNYLLKVFKVSPLTLEELRDRYKDCRKFYKELGIEAEFSELNKHYWPVFSSIVEVVSPPLFAGAKEVLFFLKHNVAQVVLLTSQKQETVDFYHSYTGLLDLAHESHILTSGQHKYDKLKEIKERGASLDEANENIYIFVSDTPDDLVDGQEAGWLVYGVPTGFSSADNLRAVIRPGQGAVLPDLFELKKMFCQGFN